MRFMRFTAVALAAMSATVVVLAGERQDRALGFSFTEIAERAGLSAPTIYGGRQTNRYLLETTGTGAAAIDYDADDGFERGV